MTGGAAQPPLRPGRRWRQPWLPLVEPRWWRFLTLVTALDLLIKLLFAGLYLLDPAGIGGAGSGAGGGGSGDLPVALRVFFPSVETLATIVYGSLYPDSLWVHLVASSEAITGLILMALITGPAIARFARSPRSVVFSERARIEAVDGRECLVIRLHNSRANTIFDVRVPAFWQPPEGDPQLQPLPLLTLDGLPLPNDLCLLHPRVPGGPLSAIGPGTAVGSGELLVSFSDMDATLERPIHLVHPDLAGTIVPAGRADP